MNPSSQKDTRTSPNLYDLSSIEARRKEVVAVARDILTGKKAVIEGARLLVQLRPTVTKDDFDPAFLPFMVIASETDSLPTGEARRYWSSSALAEKDKELRRAEEIFRGKALTACQELITLFEQSK